MFTSLEKAHFALQMHKSYRCKNLRKNGCLYEVFKVMLFDDEDLFRYIVISDNVAYISDTYDETENISLLYLCRYFNRVFYPLS